MLLESNGGGSQEMTEVATVKNFGDVWFNQNSIANILSLAEVRKKFRVTMDTDIDPCKYTKETGVA
jgi:hypothetical protein